MALVWLILDQKHNMMLLIFKEFCRYPCVGMQNGQSEIAFRNGLSL